MSMFSFCSPIELSRDFTEEGERDREEIWRKSVAMASTSGDVSCSWIKAFTAVSAFWVIWSLFVPERTFPRDTNALDDDWNISC